MFWFSVKQQRVAVALHIAVETMQAVEREGHTQDDHPYPCIKEVDRLACVKCYAYSKEQNSILSASFACSLLLKLHQYSLVVITDHESIRSRKFIMCFFWIVHES